MSVDLAAGSRYRPVVPVPCRLLDPRDATISRPKILVFDSGLGGLTVLAEVAKTRPDAECVYAADDAGFPYGSWTEADLKTRVVEVVGRLIAETAPDCVVIACNTASTLVLPDLRAAFPGLPFVGTVPAIKPAAALSRSKVISVLATPGTVARDYTRALVDSFAADCAVTLVGSTRLAGFAEAFMSGEAVADADIAAEIEPCFVERDHRVTDTIVLACTHYPLLLKHFRTLAPWSVAWIDPAPAIARRVDAVLRDRGMTLTTARAQSIETRFTSGSSAAPLVARTLVALGCEDLGLHV